MSRILRAHRPERQRSQNALRNFDSDPSLTLPESHSPLASSLSPAAYPHVGGSNSRETMAQTSDSPAAFDMLQGADLPQEEWFKYIDFGDEANEKAPETAVKMELGPSHSSESSQSENSSVSSKRQKSNDGSARSSFSVTYNNNNQALFGHGLSDDWLENAFAPGPKLNSHFHQSTSIDTMNQMAGNLAFESAENSPTTDSSDSNSANNTSIAAMAMPYDASPGIVTNPAAITQICPEASFESPEASPVTMNCLPYRHSQLTNFSVSQQTHEHSAQPSFYHPPSQNPGLGQQQWNQQNLAVSTVQPKIQYQKLSWLSQIPHPRRPRGKYFDLKSNRTGTRVETALNVRLILTELPAGITKLRLHEDHLTKAKQLKDSHLPLPSNHLELRTTVFCHSALHTTDDVREAFSIAASIKADPPYDEEEDTDEKSPTKDKSDQKHLTVTPVRICTGCVGREKKRLKRSKEKPHETPEWLHKTSRCTVAFISLPVVDWKSNRSTNAAAQLLAQPEMPTGGDKDGDNGKKPQKKLPPPPVDPGTVAADVEMRICCYCRHQNEPTGFRVVFTLRDHLGQVYDQQISNPIMITDDHKDKEKRDSAPTTPPGITEGTPLPNGQFVFPVGHPPLQSSENIQQSYSTPNLPAAAQGYGYMPQQQQVNHSPHAISHVSSYNDINASFITSETLTPLTPGNRSRAASPTALAGHQQKKRKASGSGQMLEQLQMTPLQSPQAQNPQTQNPQSPSYPYSSAPNGATVAARKPPQTQIHRRNRVSNSHNSGAYRTNPPSPGYGNFDAVAEANRSRSMQDLPAAVFSTPASSRQSGAHSPTAGAHTNPMFSQHNLNQAFDDSLRNSQAIVTYDQARPRSQPRPQPYSQTSQASLPQANPQHPQVALRQYNPQSSATSQTLVRAPIIFEMIPESGPIQGGTKCIFVGSGLQSDLQVFFGHRRATSVWSYTAGTLMCIAPPGDQPGKVPLRFQHQNPQQLPSPGIESNRFYEYVVEDRPKGVPQTLQNQSRNQSSEHMIDYGQPLQQYPNGMAMTQYHQQPNMPQHRYNTSEGQGFTETPPSYHDVLAEDDQRILDMKTRSTLRAVGDALMDEKARERFDSVVAEPESSRAMQRVTNSPENSMVMQRITIGRRGVSQEEQDKLRAEREKKVKGLRNDRKLWMVWIPILVFVLIAMLYDRFPQIGLVLALAFTWVRDNLLSPVGRSASGAFGLYHRNRIQQDHGRVVGAV